MLRTRDIRTALCYIFLLSQVLLLTASVLTFWETGRRLPDFLGWKEPAEGQIVNVDLPYHLTIESGVRWTSVLVYDAALMLFLFSCFIFGAHWTNIINFTLGEEVIHSNNVVLYHYIMGGFFFCSSVALIAWACINQNLLLAQSISRLIFAAQFLILAGLGGWAVRHMRRIHRLKRVNISSLTSVSAIIRMQQLEFMIEFGAWLVVVFFLYAFCSLIVDLDYLSGLSRVGSSFIASHLFGFLGWFTTALLVPLVVLLMFPRPYLTLLIMLTLLTDESIGLDPALHLMNPQNRSVDHMSTIIEEAITIRARSYRDSIGYAAFTRASGILPLDEATRKQLLNDSLHQLTTHEIGPMDKLHSRTSLYTRSSVASSFGARLRYSALSHQSHLNYSAESLNRSNGQFSGRYNVPATPHSAHGDLPPVPPLPVIQRATTNNTGRLDSPLTPSLSVPSTPGFEEVAKNLQSMPELNPQAWHKPSPTASPKIYRSKTHLSKDLNDRLVPANGIVKKSAQCGKGTLGRSLSVLTSSIPTISLTELNQDDKRTTSRKSLGCKLTNLSSKKSTKKSDFTGSKGRTSDNLVKRTRNLKKLPALPPAGTGPDEAATSIPLWTRTTPPSPAAGLKAFHRRATSLSTTSPGVDTLAETLKGFTSTAYQDIPSGILYPELPQRLPDQADITRPLRATPPVPGAAFPNKAIIPELPDPQLFPLPPSSNTPHTAGLPPPSSAFMSSSGITSLRPPSPVYCPSRTTRSEYNMLGDNYNPMKTSTFAGKQTIMPEWQSPPPAGLPIKSVESLPMVKTLPPIVRSQTAAFPYNTSRDTLVDGQSSPIDDQEVHPDEKNGLHTNLRTILLPQYPLTRSTNQVASQLFELLLPTPTFGKDVVSVSGQSLIQLNPQDCLRLSTSAASLPRDDGMGRFEQVRNLFRHKRKGASLPPRQKLGEPTTSTNGSPSFSADRILEHPGGVGPAKLVHGRCSQPSHYLRNLGSTNGFTAPSATSSRIQSLFMASFLPNPVKESVSLLEYMPSLFSTYSSDSSFDFEGNGLDSHKGTIKRKRQVSSLGSFELPNQLDASDNDGFDYRVKFSPNPSRGGVIHVLPPSDQPMRVRSYSTLTSPPSYVSTLHKQSFHRVQTASMQPKDMTFRLSYRDSLRQKEHMNSSEETYHTSFDEISRFYGHSHVSPNLSRTPSSRSSSQALSHLSGISAHPRHLSSTTQPSSSDLVVSAMKTSDELELAETYSTKRPATSLSHSGPGRLAARSVTNFLRRGRGKSTSELPQYAI
ncbi:hypothetical protein IWQ61_003314 [Dispira simplex]|nr:hypothetical protein IWQ61_003314 [Dispira simplex]